MGIRRIALIFLVFTQACSTNNISNDDSSKAFEKTAGNRFYGGTFRLNESEQIKTLFPPFLKDVVSARTSSIVFEGLFRFNQKTLEIEKCLVEDYEVDGSGTVYTFTLRDSIYFHNDQCFKDSTGRLLTSEDVAFCFRNLFTKMEGSATNKTLVDLVLGGREFYEKSNTSDALYELEGFEVLSSKRFKVTLKRPNSLFLQKLAMPETFIYAPEAFLKYGTDFSEHAVGTGAFILKESKDQQIVFFKNPRYYGRDGFGNQLPFLEKISLAFNRDKKSEFVAFTEGELDMVYRIPTKYLSEILEDEYQNSGGEYGRFLLQRNPEMMTQFLGFNNSQAPFDDINFRKAISYAINRVEILDHVLQGEGYQPGTNGITPPGFDNYPIDSILGYRFNQDSALFYFKKSNVAQLEQKPSITLWLNSDGDRNTHVCVKIKEQLANTLGIDVKLEIVPLSVLQEKIFDGSAKMYRIGWLADLPSPENFLILFYSGKNPSAEDDLNFFGYRNQKFNRVFEEAIENMNIENAHEKYLEAEQILMKDAPVTVLWYDEGYRLLQPYVRNFPNNPMQYRTFNEVYFEKPETLERQSL